MRISRLNAPSVLPLLLVCCFDNQSYFLSVNLFVTLVSSKSVSERLTMNTSETSGVGGSTVIHIIGEIHGVS